MQRVFSCIQGPQIAEEVSEPTALEFKPQTCFWISVSTHCAELVLGLCMFSFSSLQNEGAIGFCLTQSLEGNVCGCLRTMPRTWSALKILMVMTYLIVSLSKGHWHSPRHKSIVANCPLTSHWFALSLGFETMTALPTYIKLTCLLLKSVFIKAVMV